MKRADVVACLAGLLWVPIYALTWYVVFLCRVCRWLVTDLSLDNTGDLP